MVGTKRLCRDKWKLLEKNKEWNTIQDGGTTVLSGDKLPWAGNGLSLH